MNSNNVSLFSNNISNCHNTNKMGSAKKPTNGIFSANTNNAMFNSGMNQNINLNVMTPPKQQTNAFSQQPNQLNTEMQNQGINANIFGNAGIGHNNMMMNNNMGLMQSSTLDFNQGTYMMGQAPTTSGTFDYSYRVTSLFEQGRNNSNVPLKMVPITAMQIYMAKSIEELRYEDYCLKRSGRSVKKSNAVFGGKKGNLNTTFYQGGNVQAGNQFGSTTNTATTNKTTQSGLFGGKDNTYQQGSLFNHQQSNSVAGIINNLTPNTTVSFKQNTTSIFTQPQAINTNHNQSVFRMNPSGSSVQGGNQQGDGLFGGNTNQSKPNTGSSFFNSSTNIHSNISNTTSNNLFSQGGGHLFGNQPKKTNISTNITSQAGGLFDNIGTTNSANTKNSSLLFNNNPTQSTNLFLNPTHSGNMFQSTTPQPSDCLFSQPTLGVKTSTQTDIGAKLFGNGNQNSLFFDNLTTQKQGTSSGLFGNTGKSNATTYNPNLFGTVNTQPDLFDNKSLPTELGGLFPRTKQGLFASPQNTAMMKPTELTQPIYINQNPSHIKRMFSGNDIDLAFDSYAPILIKIEDVIRLYYDSVNESIKVNNKEMSEIREEIKLLLRQHAESQLNSNDEKIFKAVNEFDNYMLQNDSVEYFFNKMRLYKDVLMNLEDDKISKWLNEGFCSLYNMSLNEFGSSF
jgi:hypothetical protein